MNPEKIQQLTESIHRTVEALNEHCRSTSSQTTQAPSGSWGSVPHSNFGSYPMGYGWNPFRAGSVPTFGASGQGTGNWTPWQGWNATGMFPGMGFYPTGTGYPTSYQPSYYSTFGYPGMQTAPGSNVSFPYYGSTTHANGFYPSFSSWNYPTFGWGYPMNFSTGSFYGGMYGNTPTFGQNCFYPGFGPTGFYGSTGFGFHPFSSFYGGFGQPFYGPGQPYPNQTTPDCVTGTHGPQTWGPNCGPTGVVDIPLAA